MKLKFLTLLMITVLAGCISSGNFSSPSNSVVPVTNFQADRYLGKWYELARIENRFERGLIKTSAQYSKNPDGSIKVINGGYDPAQKKYRDVEGKAKFVGSPNEGALKVSFFGPFYSGYNVVALDKDYQWAIVTGNDPNKYFWVLSRKPVLTKGLKGKALGVAKELNIDPGKILWIPQ